MRCHMPLSVASVDSDPSETDNRPVLRVVVQAGGGGGAAAEHEVTRLVRMRQPQVVPDLVPDQHAQVAHVEAAGPASVNVPTFVPNDAAGSAVVRRRTRDVAGQAIERGARNQWNDEDVDELIVRPGPRGKEIARLALRRDHGEAA